jgi:hypothetical protein
MTMLEPPVKSAENLENVVTGEKKTSNTIS